MQRSLPEISQSIDVNSRVIDQSAENLYRRFHGRIVKSSPIGLIPIVYVNDYIVVLAI